MTTATDVEWTGTGWRAWRVERRWTQEGPMWTLRNPWANTGLVYWWLPRQVQTASCFWIDGARPPRLLGMNLNPKCQGIVSSRCTCGIRSMATLGDLARTLAQDGQLRRDPAKSTVVGRIRIGGKVQHRMPGPLSDRPGYQRSEFAEIVGPLYVSPLGERWLDGLTKHYGPDLLIVPPSATPAAAADGQQSWLDLLADWHAEVSA